MSGGVIAGVLAGTLGALFLGVFTSLLTKETEGFIDALPGLVLRLARRRLPADGRDDLYDEWAAELHIALHQTEGRPLSRLVLGIRYAAGLLRDCCGPPAGPPTNWGRPATPPRNGGMTTARRTPLPASCTASSPRTSSAWSRPGR